MSGASIPSDATELERLALELLSIPSVIGNEAAICDFCEAWLRERKVYGITRAGENLAFQARELDPAKPTVLLLGHLDTVPKSDENPPRLEGDKIYGLGASDMKCADAVLMQLTAAAVARESRYNVTGVLYAREEGSYAESGMPEILAAAPGAFSGVDLCIAMEPTDNRFELGCLGTMHARVTLRGQRAHSARPWQGENAIQLAGPLLCRLAELEPRDCSFHGLLFREVCSATQIEYEGARNVVPGKCVVNLNFRYGPDRDGDDAVAWVHDFVRSALGERVFEERAEVEIVDLCPSGRVCGDNELLAALEAVAGDDCETVAKQAWTDVGRLSNMGLDAINFGPGHTAQAHQVGEFASRELLAESWSILERWLWP